MSLPYETMLPMEVSFYINCVLLLSKEGGGGVIAILFGFIN